LVEIEDTYYLNRQFDGSFNNICYGSTGCRSYHRLDNNKTVVQLQRPEVVFYWSISGTFVRGYDPSPIFFPLLFV